MKKPYYLKFLAAFMLGSLIISCGDDKKGGEPDAKPGDKTLVLQVATQHAIGNDMGLCYAVFDPQGDIIKDGSGEGLRYVTNINISDKSYDLQLPDVKAPANVTMLAYPMGTDVSTYLNKKISTIDDVFISSEGGIVKGDYFLGTVALAKDQQQGKLNLERKSGSIAVSLLGDKSLTESVKGVELIFSDTKLYSSMSAQGVMKVVGSTAATLQCPLTGNTFIFPTESATGTGTGRITYGDNQVKEFSWSAATGFHVDPNHCTTIKLTLSTNQAHQIQIYVNASGGALIDGSNGSLDNQGTEHVYHTYKLVKSLKTNNFIPGAIALSGNKLFVANLYAATADGNPAAPWNPKIYSVEVFDISTGTHLGKIPGFWSVNGAKENMTGVPLSLAVGGGKLYVAGGGEPAAPYGRVVVFDTETLGFVTAIGRHGGLYSLTKSEKDMNEGTAVYIDKGYVYVFDTHIGQRIYMESDITAANHGNILPYMKGSPLGASVKPRAMSFFKDPEGMLRRTDLKSQKIYTLDPTKIVDGSGIDIIDHAKTIDLQQAMDDDQGVANIKSHYPYAVAYHHGNMFVVVGTQDDADRSHGLLNEYTPDGKMISNHNMVSGYTFLKPIGLIIKDDMMIVSDQLKAEVAIVSIQRNVINEYE